VGGTAANFARAAVPFFAEVHLLGRVGIDPVGEIITAVLSASGVRTHLSRDPDRPSGLSVVLRDDDPAAPCGIRLLLVGPDSANTTLTVTDLAEHHALLVGVDALVVDGYAMLAEPRRSACLYAMDMVSAAGGIVLFDVVPHDSFRLYGLSELQRLTSAVAVIVAEARTLGGFLGADDYDSRYDLEKVRTMLPAFAEAFGERALFLRFGLRNSDESLCVLPDAPPRYRRTGYRDTTEPDGFGDRLTVAELVEHLPSLISLRNRMRSVGVRERPPRRL
jgi:sugar/nucleoside kinase (ribokinase family)